MLYLTYSTGMVNPSIFGLKSTIDGFLGAKTKGKPLGMRGLLGYGLWDMRYGLWVRKYGL
jgi:hypothetical protein